MAKVLVVIIVKYKYMFYWVRPKLKRKCLEFQLKNVAFIVDLVFICFTYMM